MARICIPPPLRPLVAGGEWVETSATTVEEALAELERRYPPLRGRLRQADGRLAAGWAVVIDGVAAPLGLRAALAGPSEVHFLPAIGGG